MNSSSANFRAPVSPSTGGSFISPAQAGGNPAPVLKGTHNGFHQGERRGGCYFKLIHGDCLEYAYEIPAEAVVVSDPPFNIGYHYANYSDNMKPDDYMEMLRIVLRPPSVIIHYPEAICDISRAFGVSPTRIAQWVYPANTPRQHRSIAWFGCKPDFRKDGQDYKNPKDKRVAQLIAAGRKARLYDWWEVNQVKNVSKEKQGHPCQMPLVVMERIVRITEAPVVCDPFMGTGTTGVACRNIGRDFIGIERDENYFRIAERMITGRPTANVEEPLNLDD